MFNRILVPLDASKTSERVLPFVTMLVRQFSSPVVLVMATPGPDDLGPIGNRQRLREVADGRQRLAHTYLEGERSRLAQSGVEASVAALQGPPASVITEVAREQEADLIVMATHGRSGPERWFLGSVADRVVRTSPVPVLLMRPREGSEDDTTAVRSVILPLDGSPDAEAAIPYAIEVARSFGVPVLVTRIVPPAEAGEELSPSSLPPDLAEGAREAAELYLADVVGRIEADGGTASSVITPSSSAAEAIVDHAQRREGALIIMTTRGRSGVGRGLVGSVTAHVMRSASAPVLVVCEGHAARP